MKSVLMRYKGIGPKLECRKLSDVVIAERNMAEQIICLKRSGMSNRAVAQRVAMSLSQIERIISGSCFSFISRFGLREQVRAFRYRNFSLSQRKYSSDRARKDRRNELERARRSKLREKMSGSLFA